MIPFVEEEFETIRTILRQRASIARFGDGELRNALGRSCKVQESDSELALRLREILKNKLPKLLVGIPRSVGRFDLWRWDSKKMIGWSHYERKEFVELLDQNTKYYSSFITRPDSAFHIDCDQYWDMVKQIWAGRNVTILTGAGKFKNNLDLFDTAKLVNFINKFPAQHAFKKYPSILEEAKKIPRDHLMILALGPTATVLAYDLTKDGYQALDLGHLEMFYRRHALRQDELITKGHIRENAMLHASPRGMGTRGFKWADAVIFLANQWKCRSILDYGCGIGTLKIEIMEKVRKGLEVYEYDPAVKEKGDCIDHPVEMVVCTDVLEHVESDRLDNVLDHLNFLMGKIGFFVISTIESGKNLSTGENCHLTIQSANWWLEKIDQDRKWKSVELIPSSIFCRDGKKEIAVLVTK